MKEEGEKWIELTKPGFEPEIMILNNEGPSSINLGKMG